MFNFNSQDGLFRREDASSRFKRAPSTVRAATNSVCSTSSARQPSSKSTWTTTPYRTVTSHQQQLLTSSHPTAASGRCPSGLRRVCCRQRWMTSVSSMTLQRRRWWCERTVPVSDCQCFCTSFLTGRDRTSLIGWPVIRLLWSLYPWYLSLFQVSATCAGAYLWKNKVLFSNCTKLLLKCMSFWCTTKEDYCSFRIFVC